MNNFKYLVVILFSILISACDKDKDQTVHKHTMYMGVPSGPLKGFEKERSFIDPGVSGVELNSIQTAKQVIGGMILSQATSYGNIRVASAQRTEVLELIQKPNSKFQTFSELRLKSVEPVFIEQQEIPVLEKIPQFTTSRGITLGMPPAQVRKYLGDVEPMFEKSKDNKMLIRYRLEKNEDSDFLKKSNAMGYFADYVFEMGKLVHIHWGLLSAADTK